MIREMDLKVCTPLHTYRFQKMPAAQAYKAIRALLPELEGVEGTAEIRSNWVTEHTINCRNSAGTVAEMVGVLRQFKDELTAMLWEDN